MATAYVIDLSTWTLTTKSPNNDCIVYTLAVIGKPHTRANMRDVINLVRIIINGFSDAFAKVELFDLIFLSKTLQSYDNIMKLQTKGGKKTN